MSALLIDDAARARVTEVIAYAMDHPYRPGPGVSPPGDNFRRVVELSSYRAVFSFTEAVAQGVMLRHLSISVPGSAGYPHPIAAYAIAELFGFTGWDGITVMPPPDGWYFSRNEGHRTVIVAQRVSR